MRYFWLALAPFLFACASGGTVARRRGENVEIDRQIPAVAYAWYARGAQHERQEELVLAARAFRAVVDHDPKSGMGWASLGRVLCSRDKVGAARAFQAGLRKATRKAPVLLEQARCELAGLPNHRILKREETEIIAGECAKVEAALRLEPQNRAVTIFLADCWNLAGRSTHARRLVRGADLYFKTQDAALKVVELGSHVLLEVDHAIVAGDLRGARTLSLTELAPGALAARAALWGKVEIAREQANFVLSAAPSDGDSLVTLAALGEPLGDEMTRATPLSALGVLVFTAHLRRTVGEAAAAAFSAGHEAILASSTDPLVVAIRREPYEKPALDRTRVRSILQK